MARLYQAEAICLVEGGVMEFQPDARLEKRLASLQA
jgi:hypothetical protein